MSDGIWAPERRTLTAGLVLAVTLVAFEALAVATAMPAVARDLGGIRLYGWVFSAFLLANLVGIVGSGRRVDSHGPRGAFVGGLLLYGAGLALAGAAWSMPVLVGARVIQGLGGGALLTVAYASIGRSYPDRIRPRMMAVLSTAWVVPGLAGPALAGLVTETAGWRWVFWGILPLVAAAIGLAFPSLEATRETGVTEGTPHRLRDAMRVAVGAGLVLAALTEPTQAWAAPAGVAGVLVAWGAIQRLLPPGTLRGAPGMPAAIASRGLLLFALLGADAFVPLLVTEVRGLGIAAVGLVLTLSTLAWTAGSWVQERGAERWGVRRIARAGFVLVVAGMGGMASGLLEVVPFVAIAAAWVLAGAGTGLAYPALSVLVLRGAAPGREGTAASSMTLAETLGFALGAGSAGAAVALGEALSRPPAWGLGWAFAVTGAAAVLGLVLTGALESARAHPASA